MIEELCWIHLSDLHIKADGDTAPQTAVLEDFLRDIESRIGDFGKPQFVLISGDLAYSGREAEYEVASQFVGRLAAVLGMPTSDVFIVPGNHDVDRTRAIYQYHGVRSRINSQMDVERFLGQSSEVAHLLTRQERFWAFENSLHVSGSRRLTEDKLGYCAVRDIDGFAVAVVGLNTAWLSGPEDTYAKLVIGERHFVDVLRMAERSDPRVILAVGHHPLEWLQEWDRASCEAGLLQRVELYHRGHEHRPNVGLAANPANPCLIIAAGAAYTSRLDANSYNLIRLRVGDGECDVETVVYESAGSGYHTHGRSTAVIEIRGDLPTDASELAEALAAVIPHASNWRFYIAALLTGQVSDIPKPSAAGPCFASPHAARGEAPLYAESLALIRAAGLLRAYPADISIKDRLRRHETAISDFASMLDRLSAEDLGFAHECDAREKHWAKLLAAREHMDLARAKAMATESAEQRPYAKSLLVDAMQSDDPFEVIATARRFQGSANMELSLLAKRALVRGLIASDEREDVEEALMLAEEVIGQADASCEDWIYAAAAGEAAGHDEKAIQVTNGALDRWPEEHQLVRFAFALAGRVGNRELVERLQTLRSEEGGRHDK
jgi:hypothetical protein